MQVIQEMVKQLNYIKLLVELMEKVVEVLFLHKYLVVVVVVVDFIQMEKELVNHQIGQLFKIFVHL